MKCRKCNKPDIVDVGFGHCAECAKPKKKKFSPEQLGQLRVYWEAVIQTENEYTAKIHGIEERAKQEMGLDIEIFHGSGGVAGIGDHLRKYDLVHWHELDDEEKK